jgi:hypothetical protein
MSDEKEEYKEKPGAEQRDRNDREPFGGACPHSRAVVCLEHPSVGRDDSGDAAAEEFD